MILNDELLKNIIVMKKGTGFKNIFFFHGGLGNIENYFPLASAINDDVNVYGVILNPDKCPFPMDLDIRNMALNYYKQIKKIQKDGAYYLAGWSFGGLLSYEIMHLIETGSKSLVHCYLLDTPVPFPKVQNKQCFQVESEIDYISNYISDENIMKELRKSKDLKTFWDSAKFQLNEANFDLDDFISHNHEMAAIVLHCKFSKVSQILEYCNILRSCNCAYEKYVPGFSKSQYGTIFYADSTESDYIKGWDRYFTKVKYKKLDGDHLSVFNSDNVLHISRQIHTDIQLE